MFNFIWSGLNVVLLLSFLYVFFRAAQLLRRHSGLGMALLFGLGLFVIGCGKTKRGTPAPVPNLLANAPAQSPVANSSAQQHIELGGTNTLFLLAEYNLTNGIIEPRGLYATVSGLMLGHEWEPVTGSLIQSGSQLHYIAVLNHRWSLLGLPVFTQSDEAFEGIMPPTRRP